MAIAASRDPQEVERGLVAWFAARTPAENRPAVANLRQPTGAGISSETYLFDASRPLVARLPPPGDALFATYDLGAQARTMQLLRAHTDVPVPHVVAYEPDPSFLGAPFVIMEHVDGHIPADNPPFLVSGWVHDATPGEQRTLQRSFIEVCARIHRVDWQRAGLGFLALPGGTGLEAEIARWEGYLDWVTRGEVLTPLHDAFAWCRAHRPADEPPPSLLWGDVRIPNVVFGDDFRPRAVLDWEMATIGPVELDIGWFLAMEAMSEPRAGTLPGFVPRGVWLAEYEHLLGRELHDLRWYEAWAAWRSAVILARIAWLLHELGMVGDLRMQIENPSLALFYDLAG